MNSMKKQKDTKLKDEPTRSVGAQCANEKEWKTAPKRMKKLSQSGKDTQLWICLVVKGFRDSSVGKEFACSVGHLGSVPRLGRCPGEGKGYPLQYSSLENSWTVQSSVSKSEK